MSEFTIVEEKACWGITAFADKATWNLPDPFHIYCEGLYGAEHWGPNPLTLFELSMHKLSWALRSKPEWQRKAADPRIRAKWRQEALAQMVAAGSDATAPKKGLLSEKMIDYILAELAGYAKIADNEKGIERGCFDAIWYSDRLVPTDVAQRLKTAALALEDVPEDQQDWHPGSNGQVLDLVHPSLYCVVYGRTHAYLPGKPRIPSNFLPVQAPPCPQRYLEKWTSANFSWMPSDFTVDRRDGSVKLASPYINNLHPGLHQPLYRVIEEVLTGFVPMFERVLGDTNREGDRSPFSNQDRPEYAGGSWHVEGMVNESIAASGIYYYDEENITESKLAFRFPIGEPEYHGQYDGECIQMLYGMARDSDCIQEIGAMVTKAGRALSWPNLFQHCVSPFKLADPSKPGHRKILAIFLVNPTVDPIISATDVPPQQAEWAAEAFEQACADSASTLGEFPQELRDIVKENFPATVMTLEEAEDYRRKLMKERTVFVEDHTGRAYGQMFNMCQH
ncbi:hypothetical protein B0H17DRAFT_1331910 [Mycena rosella]|uniref:Uncharacterized protein n=1 Tax=Mycena rosella TaxID=1033263 RepID=A0AAD7GH92_MYCRO|nr:hypothetical protein B0H17DRAFT_1331910 [Mycena rosella]